MKQKFLFIICSVLVLSPAFAQTPEKQPTPEELASKEAERLETLLELEPWQVFYVDSILQHDYAALQAELLSLQKAKVENYDLYMDVRDKWAEQIDNSYHRYFNEDQWAKYLKTGAARAKKARDKRRANKK